jgi:hypothetical protein
VGRWHLRLRGDPRREAPRVGHGGSRPKLGEDAYVSDEEYYSFDGLYARCVVVANGRELYEAVLKEPREMPQDMEFEYLLSVAESAFERKTDEEFNFTPRVSYETGMNQAGWRTP